MQTKYFTNALLTAFGLLLLVVGGTGCNKMVEVPKPANEILLTNAFHDSVSATGGITAIYAQMLNNGSFEWGGITLYTSENADELLKVSSPDPFQLDTVN